MVCGPAAQTLELPLDQRGVAFKSTLHVSLQIHWRVEFGEEDESDVFVQLKIDACLSPYSLQLCH